MSVFLAKQHTTMCLDFTTVCLYTHTNVITERVRNLFEPVSFGESRNATAYRYFSRLLDEVQGRYYAIAYLIWHYMYITLYIGLNEENLTLEEVLIFFSGAEAIPPLGFSKKARLYYLQDILYPETSTCGLTLTLPTKHNEYDIFKSAMIFGIRYDRFTDA